MKYSQLGQNNNICDVSSQPTRTLYRRQKPPIILRIRCITLNRRSTTFIIRYIRQYISNIKTSRQLYSLTMTTKATFCQLHMGSQRNGAARPPIVPEEKYERSIQSGPKKVIHLVQCNVMYERYHFFGPPCTLHCII